MSHAPANGSPVDVNRMRPPRTSSYRLVGDAEIRGLVQMLTLRTRERTGLPEPPDAEEEASGAPRVGKFERVGQGQSRDRDPLLAQTFRMPSIFSPGRAGRVVAIAIFAAVCGFGGAFSALTLQDESLSVEGPSGPEGPQGEPGVVGPTGPAGPSGPRGPAGRSSEPADDEAVQTLVDQVAALTDELDEWTANASGIRHSYTMIPSQSGLENFGCGRGKFVGFSSIPMRSGVSYGITVCVH